MANKIVHAKRPLSLGLGQGTTLLKVGKNIIHESSIDENSWFVKSLVSSGDITIEKMPEEPSVENGKLIEVTIGQSGAFVKPFIEPAAVEFPIHFTPAPEKAAPEKETPAEEDEKIIEEKATEQEHTIITRPAKKKKAAPVVTKTVSKFKRPTA